MLAQKTNGTGPLVVGTIHSPGSLRRALRLRPGGVDVLELRVDHFAQNPEALLSVTERLPAPLIVTVRHPAEGGAGELTLSRREELYAQFLPVAAYVDVEVRSLERLSGVLQASRERGVEVIVSDHHFQRTPTEAILKKRWQLARKAGASLVKVAARLEDAADLARLSRLFVFGQKTPLSVMGMGPLGKVSRLLFARLGSRLNYGYLDEAQVPGQWEATRLKERLQELFAE